LQIHPFGLIISIKTFLLRAVFTERERLGTDEITLVLQQNRLRWYGHVLRKEDDDWVKKCMEYEVEGPRIEEDQRGPGQRL